ncbi:uncharacterized protein F5Z01DRAFT_466790 [Emericellopsis atlantica]|uniref:Uncharacterized protein n=1 Tax=Emericellopsis atlantica TaxID=2614577 RepID=A0A9P7ZCV1_9HYPO|nr:uncharacterized protein F5Z01DRAFT_466790 [Emericellopsis atlantica]KAG9249744.1 hypothetical protein F5Z01DRAFT_466790 [Emericellopsis atlantica]
MSLHLLPIEVLSLILQEVDCPRDLFSLVGLSGPCFRAYESAPNLILSSVLRNAIAPTVLHHALAILNVPDAPGPDPQTEVLEGFIDRYLQAGSSFEFPADTAAMTALRRLHSRISYFVDDYSSRTMRALATKPDGQQGAGWDLSSSERARFQRAFFRYELYSLVFPVDHSVLRHSLFPADLQFARFLAHMEPWEVEEMSCVHHYFTSRIEGLIDRLEDQVVEAVLSAPGVRSSPSHPILAEPLILDSLGPSSQPTQLRDDSEPPGRSDKSERGGSPDDDDDDDYDDDSMVRFNSLDLLDLDLFSRGGRFRLPEIVSYLASLGSGFLHELLVADNDERKDIIRRNSPLSRDFLPEAVDQAPATGPRTVIPGDIANDDDPRRPSLGYYSFKRPDQDVYLEISHEGILNAPLRERAFVFWDAARVTQPMVRDSLREASQARTDEVNRILNRHERQSPEERLEGVKMPRAVMDTIMAEFGSTFDWVSQLPSP